MKPCAKCGIHPRVLSKNKSRACYCKQCWSDKANEWNKKNFDHLRNKKYQEKYGITLEDFEAMEKAQNGLCAICFEPEKENQVLSVDHDHKTNKVRGLLCGNCNRGIGNLKDSPAVLYRAIEYLNSYADTSR